MDTIIYRNQEIKIFNDSSYDWNPREEDEIIHQDQWLTGDIWRYEIEAGGNGGGYFGSDHDDSGLLADAKSDIDWDIKRQREKRAKILKTYIKGKVPLQYRTKLRGIDAILMDYDDYKHKNK